MEVSFLECSFKDANYLKELNSDFLEIVVSNLPLIAPLSARENKRVLKV